MELINIPVGNRKIVANLIRPEKLKTLSPALLFIHGWQSDKTGNTKRAEALSKLGFICLCIDLSGHGESSGELGDFSRKDHLEDVISSYDYLRNLSSVDSEQIGVIGASYGAYLGAMLALKRKLKWLMMRVPALYFDQQFEVPTKELIGDEDNEAFRSTDLVPEESSALKAISDFKGNLLIIESENDQVIPKQTIENYLRFAPEKTTHVVMKNTAHSLETREEEMEYIKILEKFLTKKS